MEQEIRSFQYSGYYDEDEPEKYIIEISKAAALEVLKEYFNADEIIIL